MQIRYGFDIALDLAQPATVLTMMDVHSDARSGVVQESALELAPILPVQRFIDEFDAEEILGDDLEDHEQEA